MDQLQLLPPQSNLSNEEQTTLAQIFAMPVVKRYLNYLMWDNLTAIGNIPLNVLVEEERNHLLTLAFLKGSMSTLHTLLSITNSEGDSNGNV
jgi:hypothetical protein